jgi:hypothetical protein
MTLFALSNSPLSASAVLLCNRCTYRIHHYVAAPFLIGIPNSSVSSCEILRIHCLQGDQVRTASPGNNGGP